jgi:hypothetical protein
LVFLRAVCARFSTPNSAFLGMLAARKMRAKPALIAA